MFTFGNSEMYNGMGSVLITTLGVFVRWLICVISYYRVFGAKTQKGTTRKPAKW